jgi:hypothetical protein
MNRALLFAFVCMGCLTFSACSEHSEDVVDSFLAVYYLCKYFPTSEFQSFTVEE